jgi:hypothetical protein
VTVNLNEKPQYTNLTVVGGMYEFEHWTTQMLGTYMHPPIGGRVLTKQVDVTCQTGYSFIGVKLKTLAEMVTEYYVVHDFSHFRRILCSDCFSSVLSLCVFVR